MPTGIYKRTDKTRRALSEAQKRVGTVPPSRKGALPWNKGKTGIYTEETLKKIKLGRAKQIIVHSKETKAKIGLAHSKDKSPFWKGGVSALNRDYRKLCTETAEYRHWRHTVFARDNYTCLICCTEGSKLHAHHIKKWSVYPDLRITVSNGATVCERCDVNLVNHHEEEWEPYFRLMLEVREDL